MNETFLKINHYRQGIIRFVDHPQKYTTTTSKTTIALIETLPVIIFNATHSEPLSQATFNTERRVLNYIYFGTATVIFVLQAMLIKSHQ